MSRTEFKIDRTFVDLKQAIRSREFTDGAIDLLDFDDRRWRLMNEIRTIERRSSMDMRRLVQEAYRDCIANMDMVCWYHSNRHRDDPQIEITIFFGEEPFANVSVEELIKDAISERNCIGEKEELVALKRLHKIVDDELQKRLSEEECPAPKS
ncbi:MAG TPA: hypothetical protein VKA31_06300 [Mariprofundaceae bacterium]|nr:hypothetical protein [Mariprofundaceae bacterium]